MEQYKSSAKILKKYDIIDVRFPKFRLKSEIDLKYLLSEMGLTDIFSNKADFSLMSDSSLYINKMKQNIEIEAEFYANRPFVYFIRDYFGSICFAGVFRGCK